MGCVSSKHVRKEIEREVAAAAHVTRHHVPNHVVSLTSSTYGALKLDAEEATAAAVIKDCLATAESNGDRTTGIASKRKSPPREEEQPPEVINAWELMEDLEEAVPASRSNRNSPKPRALSTPLKFLSNPIGSPKAGRRQSGGKENRGSFTGPKVVGPVKPEFTPRNASLKSHNSCKAAMGMRVPPVWTPKRNSFGSDNGLSSRRSLGPLFDPELVESYEKELSVNNHEEIQIKKMIIPSPKIRKLRNGSKDSSDSILSKFQKKCPSGGENSVVIYTTTLRGIRKTFEDCNIVRSVIESHLIQVSERDVSMDSGYKEELRGLMGTKQVRVPAVFVKGRMIGGAEEVVKLEEEGKLGIILDGIPRASISGCEGCGGVRFVMCMDCNGSCKVLDEDGKKVIKCGECNENGLIHCPLCC
ncbi:hypothetical protein CDL15_Pgr002106 [Punica granatum]|uniref:Glutaredoxin domain-containing protein n=1 Tax=Punica granatum TaxID=22663 RepID=A0A218XDH0_PUNGR|nr:hypothetical protein CDL15_Pgr002106 [Punica granatum]